MCGTVVIHISLKVRELGLCKISCTDVRVVCTLV